MTDKQKIREIARKHQGTMTDAQYLQMVYALEELSEWQNEQMLKDAVKGVIGDIVPLIEVDEMNNYLNYVKAHGLKPEDKVKIIIIKEE